MGLKRPYGSSPVLLKAVLPISRVSRPFEWRESIFGDAAPDAVLLPGRQGETEALPADLATCADELGLGDVVRAVP
jgi:hypothetical protein